MQLQLNPRGEPALTLTLRSQELPIFRAALERASFIDTRPEMQGVVLDFVAKLLEQLPPEESAGGGRTGRT